ncbi:MAG: hypothetical protein U0O22_01355 [Acutalibacteraceae bacterium]
MSRKMTNFERIKQMTVEEFAKMFNSALCRQMNFDGCKRAEGNCQECAIAWLNQEVEDDNL